VAAGVPSGGCPRKPALAGRPVRPRRIGRVDGGHGANRDCGAEPLVARREAGGSATETRIPQHNRDELAAREHSAHQNSPPE